MRGWTRQFWRDAACVGTLALLAGPAAAAADFSIAPGRAVTFRLEGTPGDLAPHGVRNAPIGPEDSKAGEITVGLGTATGALGKPRMHVFERTTKPVRFQAVAYSGMKVLDKQTLCGPLAIDFWSVFPAETKRVVLFSFAEQEGPCP